MIEPSAGIPSDRYWEERVLDALAIFTMPLVFASTARLVTVLVAVVAISLGPAWLSMPLNVVFIVLAAAYWAAFGAKMLRRFRAGYRENA